MRVTRGKVLFLVFVITLLSPATASAQLRKVCDNNYALSLDSILNEWNTRDLILPPKSRLKEQFVNRLDRAVATKPGGYEGKQWENALLARWSKLPEHLAPRLKVTDGARLILIGGLIDNLSELQSQGVKANKQSVLEATQLSLFILLGWSQNLALSRGASAISSDYVRVAVDTFFTGVFPFCRPGPPPPPPPAPPPPPCKPAASPKR